MIESCFSKEELAVLEQAIDTYGWESQTDMMIEEMSELTQSLLKFRRARQNPTKKALDKLMEYKTAEKEGRLLVLPCKVGDSVWSAEPFADKQIREGKIVQINIDEDGLFGFWSSFYPYPVTSEFIVDDIGKTVFRTREEAEAKLKERGE